MGEFLHFVHWHFYLTMRNSRSAFGPTTFRAELYLDKDTLKGYFDSTVAEVLQKANQDHKGRQTLLLSTHADTEVWQFQCFYL